MAHVSYKDLMRARQERAESPAEPPPIPSPALPTESGPVGQMSANPEPPRASQHVNIAPVNKSSPLDDLLAQNNNKSTSQQVNKSTPYERKMVGFRLDPIKLKALKDWCLTHNTTVQAELERHVDTLTSQHVDRSTSQQVSRDMIDEDLSDHHLQQVKRRYEALTGMRWTRNDEKNYRRVATVPINELLGTMQLIQDRAPQRIGSFAYFVTGYYREKEQQQAERIEQQARRPETKPVTAPEEWATRYRK